MSATRSRAGELRLADGLALPLDAVTRAGVITGQRGTGKTSTAAVEVEEASAAGAPSVVIDPTNAMRAAGAVLYRKWVGEHERPRTLP